MKDQLEARLAQFNQQHLLRHWDELSVDRQAALAAEIESLDLATIQRLFRGEQAAEDWAALARRAQAPPAYRLNSPSNPHSPRQARERGETALRAGEVGVILVAGGQGTRLGFDHPKGMFPLGPVSGATLFEILFDKLLATRRRYNVSAPLYLMTSPATHTETVDYLHQQQRFGLPAEDLHVFCQGTMPAVDDRTGRLLLAEKGRLFLSPDGHGGMLTALNKAGTLEEMRRRGLRHLFYFQVDNPLTVVCDPEFIGYHLLAGSQVSTQVIAKRTPRDNVGNVVSIDGQVRILEYSDLNPLPDDIVLRTEADGSPVFWAGNIAVHVFDLAFLARMAASDTALPFHVARKKVPYIDDHGQPVEPAAANARKFERFIFDLLPSAERAIVVEVDELRTFAPVKNGASEKRDTPATVQAQMVALHREWLEQAGAVVEPAVQVEICPRFALDAAEASTKIAPGTRISTATHFR